MKRAAAGALLLSLVVGSTAMAGQGYRGPGFQGDPDHRDSPRSAPSHAHEHVRDDRGRDHNFGRRDHDYGRDNHYRPAPPPPRYVYRPAPPRYVYHPAPSRFGVYHPPRGYYARSWRRGDRLPAAYYARPYVIGNYRDCGLRAPPRGYHWVRVNNDAVLAAVATGVVLESVFHLF